jgi:hypothetical protein
MKEKFKKAVIEGVKAFVYALTGAALAPELLSQLLKYVGF